VKTEAERALHWSQQKEEAAGYWHVQILLILFRLFPVIVMRLLAFPIGFFYFLFSKKGREESCRFLQRVVPFMTTAGKISGNEAGRVRTSLSPLKHIIAFCLTLVEKVEVWGGKFSFDRLHFQNDDIRDLILGLERGEGAFLICSHLGNAELLRGLASFNRTGVSRKIAVSTLMDFTVTAHFNRMIRELNPQSEMRIISVNDIDPQTAILLQERLTAGELVVIAGDRTSAHSLNKCFMFPFLGKEAPFAQGAFSLAALLGAPVYFVFALRRRVLSLTPDYNMHVLKSPLSFDCPRKERNRRVEELARSFAAILEDFCKQQPLQWYNFYDFWAKPAAAARTRAKKEEV
jgi:predicted LPLAT superfamily acyltransferase